MFKPLPFPNHHRVNDPLWQRLWVTYSDVITMLRSDGIPTDVEMCGGEFSITAELPNGCELAIQASDENGVEALPLDRAELGAWHVMHLCSKGADRHLVYDSARGDQAANGTDVLALMAVVLPHAKAEQDAAHQHLAAGLDRAKTEAPEKADGPELPANVMALLTEHGIEAEAGVDTGTYRIAFDLPDDTYLLCYPLDIDADGVPTAWEVTRQHHHQPGHMQNVVPVDGEPCLFDTVRSHLASALSNASRR
ncbi:MULTISPECIES: hypothetical protein [unclassified Streptomyces]|uniref:hypothetical protein n=1 Tax=unclassified Streptomyces TaxID=2593676 RepID=UPI00131D61C9|nr:MULTISPECIES: hypothetical protein [unclassified Streptomyces]